MQNLRKQKHIKQILVESKTSAEIKNTKRKNAKNDDLEYIIHGICKRYGYSQQGIKEYWENGEFVYYNCSVLNSKREWVGYVYGKTLWELEAKLLIKIYAEIMKEKKESE